MFSDARGGLLIKTNPGALRPSKSNERSLSCKLVAAEVSRIILNRVRRNRPATLRSHNRSRARHNRPVKTGLLPDAHYARKEQS